MRADFRTFGAGLLISLLANLVGNFAQAAEPGTWGVWLGGGFHLLSVHESPLGDQFAAADHGFHDLGKAVHGGVQHNLSDWLIVGGNVDVRWISGSGPWSLNSPLQPAPDLTLLQTGLRAFVQPTACMSDFDCSDGGFRGGVQVGIGGGPTWLTYRNETDTGFHLRGDIAMVWIADFGPVFVSLRVVNGLLWQPGIGPQDLGLGLVWVPNADVLMGFQW